MDTTTKHNTRTLLVAGYSKSDKVADNMAELTELCKSALLDVVGSVVQTLSAINVATYIGEGKVEEIAQKVLDEDIGLVVFDNQLTGSQIRNIEKVLEIRVIDRNMLILDLFATRAQSLEGKLQVELALLKYTLPRLSGISGSSGRFGEGGVGSRGPGETKLELDKRKIKEQINSLEKDIKNVKLNRKEQKKNRVGLKNVALIGYTNSGKSTLLNNITKADAYADDRLFATLDTLSRKVWDNGVSYILTDTVGFVSRLPHELTHAFSATLEESVSADLLLIIFDASDDLWYTKLQVVEKVLEELEVDKSKYIYVANKVDKAPQEYLDAIDELFGDNMVHISALKNENVDSLKTIIRDRFSK